MCNLSAPTQAQAHASTCRRRMPGQTKDKTGITRKRRFPRCAYPAYRAPGQGVLWGAGVKSMPAMQQQASNNAPWISGICCIASPRPARSAHAVCPLPVHQKPLSGTSCAAASTTLATTVAHTRPGGPSAGTPGHCVQALPYHSTDRARCGRQHTHTHTAASSTSQNKSLCAALCSLQFASEAQPVRGPLLCGPVARSSRAHQTHKTRKPQNGQT